MQRGHTPQGDKTKTACPTQIEQAVKEMYLQKVFMKK